jgi:phosphate transport system substrate-binding protein
MMRTFVTLFFSTLFLSPANAGNIMGAGSSAASPLYKKWAEAYREKTGANLDYQAVGSSAGLKQVKAREVDFGASDVAQKSADLKKENLVQFPSAISGVVPVVNLPGYRGGDIKLSGEVLARIYERKITLWNAPDIANLNQNVNLPDKTIEVIARSDGSGTTYNFTNYLSKISADWQKTYGNNSTITWHKEIKQVKGSSGVAAEVKKTPFSIGYIDYNYVSQENLDAVKLKNKEGKFIMPSTDSFAAALNASEWKKTGNFEETLTDKAGARAWPIAMGTFIILQKSAPQIEKTIAALQFFTWSFMNGDYLVGGVDFVRLPDAIQARVFKEMTSVTDADGKPLKWTPR